jgi:small subunit ribosomal protein S2
VILDLKKEALAVHEARRLGIPVVALVDTNCDPDEADYVIPGNDDAIRSCNLIVHALAEAINAAKQKVSTREFEQQAEAAPEAAEAAPEAAESAPEDDVEDVAAGEEIQPVTEGDSVPVPTGEDPAKEGAEETKRSAAALGDPTRGEKEA